MLETYVLTEGLNISELPREGNYYLIASNGVFLHKDTGLFEGFVKIDNFKGLGKLNPRIKPKLPKIPAEIIYKAHCFFYEVFNRHKSEAALMLYYNKDEKTYYLYCPNQVVSHAGVIYDKNFDVINNKEHRDIVNWFKDNGFRRVGSIHSHCDFSAFHSHVDTNDESEKNGIHITLGHVDSTNLEIAASFAINNNRFPVDPENIIKGLVKMPEEMNYTVNKSVYDFDFTDDQFEELEEVFQPEIENEWLPLVKY